MLVDHTLLVLFCHLEAAATCALARRDRDEAGQASAEYALVLLGAAAVAALVIGWALKTGKIDDLLDGVIDQVLGKAKL